MKKTVILILTMLAFPLPLSAAFEPMPESPWLQGGMASSVFPRSPLVLSLNPASLGLLEASCVCASASRPFGLSQLDRAAVAGALETESMFFGGMLSVSGDDAYTEFSADAGCSFRLLPGVLLGPGISLKRLQISGYGRATGCTADLGLVWSPVRGIYSSIAAGNLLRTGLGSSGDPAGPRTLGISLGVVPSRQVMVSLGAAGQEGVDMEYSVQTVFRPLPALGIASGIRTGPARFWAALEVSLSSLGFQYGYGDHSTLPGTHSVALSWGGGGFQPETLALQTGNEEEAPVEFPLNVNTATEQELMAVPGIGPAKASAIYSWVRTNGPIDSVERLQEVPGIGPSLMQVIREHLTAL